VGRGEAECVLLFQQPPTTQRRNLPAIASRISHDRTLPPSALSSFSSTKLRVTFGWYLIALNGISGGVEGNKASIEWVIASL